MLTRLSTRAARMARCASSLATPAEIKLAVVAKATIIDLRGAAEFVDDPMVSCCLLSPWLTRLTPLNFAFDVA